MDADIRRSQKNVLLYSNLKVYELIILISLLKS